MKLITLDQARDHVKADGDDDELLTAYCNMAEAMCARIANRNLYATTADLNAAVAGIPAAMTAAYATYDAAVETANAQDDDRIKTMMLAQAQIKLAAATNNAELIAHGLALDAAPDAAGLPGADAILAAILTAAGHFYRSREAVVTGQGAATVEVPLTTRHIMEEYRWIGQEFSA